MSWSEPVAAVTVIDGRGTPRHLVYTSTSTLVVGGALRMYGVNSKTLNSALDTTPPTFPSVSGSGCNLPRDTFQSWIDTLDPSGTFVQEVGDPLRSPQGTCVPFTRTVEDSPYEVITGRTATAPRAWTFESTIKRADFYFVYKDVHVLEMPDGAGYLMFLGRYRVLQSDAAAEGAAPNECTPGKSLSDIVVFYCPDADFASNVTGPHRLVTSLGTLADEHQVSMGRSGQTAFRAWVGVPAAVFVGDSLYLYYSCIPGVRPGDIEEDARDDVYLDDITRLFACIADYDNGDGFQARTAAAQTYAARTVVAAFSAAQLAAVLSSSTDESTWEDTPGKAVASQLRYPMRAWAADATAIRPRGVTSFPLHVARHAELLMGVSAASEPWLVDVVPAFCDDQLVAFASLQPAPPPEGGLDEEGLTGFGIWRLRAVPGGTPLDGVTATYGRDFVCRNLDDPEVAEDYIVASYVVRQFYAPRIPGSVFTYMFLDPDPVLTTAGWFLYAGDGQALELLHDPDTTCPNWQDVWPRPGGQPGWGPDVGLPDYLPDTDIDIVRWGTLLNPPKGSDPLRGIIR